MAEKYYSFKELFQIIDEPNRSLCIKIYLKNKDKFERAKGSSFKHQSWEGGYLDHIREVMNIAALIYPILNARRKLTFSLSDALLVLYLHDLEKAWKYGGNKKEVEEVKKFKENYEFVLSKTKEYNFKLNPEHLNALKYVHGEGKDYDKKKNVQGALAAFVHNCDVISARIWHNFPDTWAKKNK
ncbi:MAG: hypothetical protein NUV46_00675 [Nanoarchaeota archaeon]|nr:hypothetical protein [Nanoarchaeota archaeon]